MARRKRSLPVQGRQSRQGNGESQRLQQQSDRLPHSAGAKIIKISPVLPDTASFGTPVFLYRKIRYSFAPSASVPGTLGLFRTRMETNTTEELSAPYDTSARFSFFIGSSVTAQDDPPNDLSTLRGIQMNMTGMSERAPSGDTHKQRAPFITAVFFKNRLD